MGIQLIICMEANKKCKSDYFYIKDTIVFFYNYDHAHTKFTPIYMDGKGNYRKANVVNEIEKAIREYSVNGKDSKSYVLYFFDCDAYDSKPEDASFLKEAEKYCEQNHYRFGWFCRDVEDVYLKKRVADTEKKNTALQFTKKKKITDVKSSDLRSKTYGKQRSNICSILDDYLQRKDNR